MPEQDKDALPVLRAENEALVRNLQGKHSLTGATYAHLIDERDRLQAENARLRDRLVDVLAAADGAIDHVSLSNTPGRAREAFAMVRTAMQAQKESGK